MAHFAQLDNNNVVINVVVVADSDAPNENAGIAFLKSLMGDATNWKQTSFNTKANVHRLQIFDGRVTGGVRWDTSGTPFRKNYAGIGMIYNATIDGFVKPQPYASWTLNSTTGIWEAPVAYPSDGEDYIWDESSRQWVKP